MHDDRADIGPKDVFLRSLERCDAGRAFFKAFYTRFLASSQEVRDKFAFTDFVRQERMLRRSLKLVAAASAGDSEGLAELSRRAVTHSRAMLDIKPHLYALWLEAALATARESDPEWNDTVESSWREILGLAVHHMTHPRWSD